MHGWCQGALMCIALVRLVSGLETPACARESAARGGLLSLPQKRRDEIQHLQGMKLLHEMSAFEDNSNNK